MKIALAADHAGFTLKEAVAAFLPGYRLVMRPISRPAASAPSVGSLKVHRAQQEDLLERAFAD